MTSHTYRFHECCKGLTEESLRKSLEIVYLAHRGAFPTSSYQASSTMGSIPSAPMSSPSRPGRPYRLNGL